MRQGMGGHLNVITDVELLPKQQYQKVPKQRGQQEGDNGMMMTLQGLAKYMMGRGHMCLSS
jgi:hypothetical protein